MTDPADGSDAYAVMRRIFEQGFATGDGSIVDQLCSPDLVEHQFGMSGTGADADAVQHVKDAIRDVHRAIPDISFAIEDSVEEGDTIWVRVRVRAQGTATGPFFGPPSGRHVDITVLDVARVVGGRIVEHWGVPTASRCWPRPASSTVWRDSGVTRPVWGREFARPALRGDRPVGGPMLPAVGFAVSADAYDRFMGRYSVPLAPVFVDFANVAPGERILDVGSGPGALTSELVRRLGHDRVVAVDPVADFVGALRERHAAVAVCRAVAERLSLADAMFGGVLAQLVVHFMTDPVEALREMGRVAKPGGVVAACVWDFDEGGSPLSTFWGAAKAVDPHAPGEDALPGTRRGHLALLMRQAGLEDVEEGALSVTVAHPSFEHWWQPFELGVGPAGSYVSTLSPPERQRLRERCQELLPDAPFVVTAAAWAARALVPARQPRARTGQ